MILNSLFRDDTPDEIIKILDIDGLAEKNLRSTLNSYSISNILFKKFRILVRNICR